MKNEIFDLHKALLPTQEKWFMKVRIAEFSFWRSFLGCKIKGNLVHTLVVQGCAPFAWNTSALSLVVGATNHDFLLHYHYTWGKCYSSPCVVEIKRPSQRKRKKTKEKQHQKWRAKQKRLPPTSNEEEVMWPTLKTGLVFLADKASRMPMWQYRLV